MQASCYTTLNNSTGVNETVFKTSRSFQVKDCSLLKTRIDEECYKVNLFVILCIVYMTE